MHMCSRLLSPIRLALVPVMCALFLSVSPTSAHRLGGQFPHTAGTWLYMGYTQWGDYYTPVVNAARSWHVTPTRLIVFPENIAYSEADFYTQYRSDSWWGLAVIHPCSGTGCSYRWSDLYLNSRTLAGEADFIRQKVAAHEFGHGLGLAHTTDWWYSSIMKQGRLSYNTPQNHDINDTNAIYRYW